MVASVGMGLVRLLPARTVPPVPRIVAPVLATHAVLPAMGLGATGLRLWTASARTTQSVVVGLGASSAPSTPRGAERATGLVAGPIAILAAHWKRWRHASAWRTPSVVTKHGLRGAWRWWMPWGADTAEGIAVHRTARAGARTTLWRRVFVPIMPIATAACIVIILFLGARFALIMPRAPAEQYVISLSLYLAISAAHDFQTILPTCLICEEGFWRAVLGV